MSLEEERLRLRSFRPRPYEPEPPFRISLGQLLLWMTTTALAMLLLRPTYQPRVADPAVRMNDRPLVSSDLDVATRPAGSLRDGLVAAVVAPFYGAAILTMGMAVWSTLAGDGPLRVREPGHWLLLIIGTAFLGITLCASAADVAATSALWELMVGLGILLIFAAIALTIWACFDEDVPAAWRYPFILLAAGVGCGCLPVFLGALVCLMFAVPNDLLRGRQRDLAHWVGVATAFAVVVHFIAMIVVNL